ncbi:MAG: hypothetical protein NTZ93_03470 [Candidatus Beckwithbacteria bacterium]|nr:hypothetical protein [Candidatus Beckwithbacteria bacterium]
MVQEPKPLSRRDALKAGGAIVGAVVVSRLLTACGLKPPSTEAPPLKPTPTPETPDDPDNLIVVNGADAKCICQTKIGTSPGIFAAVDNAETTISTNAYALNWIKADKTDAVLFRGESGLGKNAIMTLANLFEEKQFNDLPELSEYNPNVCQPGDVVLFGKTSVIEYNFSQLRDGKLKSTLNQYLDVVYGYDQRRKINTLTLAMVVQDNDQWQTATLRVFEKPETGGDWTIKA